MRRVELYERMREEHRQGASIRWLASTHAVHRRTVREAIASATPPERRTPAREKTALTTEVRSFIDEVLEADRKAPRKQRHTARRLWQRLVDEGRFEVSEASVRRYVHDRRRQMGINAQVFVPQHHPDGAQGEVDFYEAVVRFPAGEVTAQIVALRSSASAAARHTAYPNASQAAFFEGIASGFEFCGGVFPVVRMDNLSAAVARVLRGRRRIEQDRFVAFRSHYGFQASYTTPGEEGAHEKGGIEGEVGRFRRRWLVPVPEVSSWPELNAYLHRCSVLDLDRRIQGREATVGQAAARERPELRPLPAEPFDLSEVGTALVDAKARITVRTNRYSVPVHLVGRRVGVRVFPMTIEVTHQGAVVAQHERARLKWTEHLVLDHYLDLLRWRPGAFLGSAPLHQERLRGSFPRHYDALLARLIDHWGEREGVRHMIEVLLLHRSHPRTQIEQAVDDALSLGVADARAVAQLVRSAGAAIPSIEPPCDVGELARFDRPAPDLSGYDTLLHGDDAQGSVS